MIREFKTKMVSGFCPMLSQNVFIEVKYKKEDFIGSQYPKAKLLEFNCNIQEYSCDTCPIYDKAYNDTNW